MQTMMTNEELLDQIEQIEAGAVGPVITISRADFVRHLRAVACLLQSEHPTGELRRATSIMLDAIVKHHKHMDERERIEMEVVAQGERNALMQREHAR